MSGPTANAAVKGAFSLPAVEIDVGKNESETIKWRGKWLAVIEAIYWRYDGGIVEELLKYRYNGETYQKKLYGIAHKYNYILSNGYRDATICFGLCMSEGFGQSILRKRGLV